MSVSTRMNVVPYETAFVSEPVGPIDCLAPLRVSPILDSESTTILQQEVDAEPVRCLGCVKVSKDWEIEVALDWYPSLLKGTMAADDGRLIFLTRDSVIYDVENSESRLIGLDPRSGRELWRNSDTYGNSLLSKGDHTKHIYAGSIVFYRDECSSGSYGSTDGFDVYNGELVVDGWGGTVAWNIKQIVDRVFRAGESSFTNYCVGSHSKSYRVNSFNILDPSDYWHKGLGGGRTAASDITATKDASTAFAVGISFPNDCLTIAYDGQTGETKWQSTLEDACDHMLYRDSKVTVSPHGDKVYARFNSLDDQGTPLARVVAYDAETGDELWQSLPHGPGSINKQDIALSPNGKVLVATGRETVGINTQNGAVIWRNPYQTSDIFGSEIAAAPSTVVVAGVEFDGTATGPGKVAAYAGSLAE